MKFESIIQLLRGTTIFGMLACFFLGIIGSFDPFGYLEMYLMQDLYQLDKMPSEAVPAFLFTFRLFCLASVGLFYLQLELVNEGIAKKQAWAFRAFSILFFIWMFGATIITISLKAWSYFISVGMIGVLFGLPVVLLWPFFGKK